MFQTVFLIIYWPVSCVKNLPVMIQTGLGRRPKRARIKREQTVKETVGSFFRDTGFELPEGTGRLRSQPPSLPPRLRREQGLMPTAPIKKRRPGPNGLTFFPRGCSEWTSTHNITESKPGEAGSIRKGKTTPSVDRTPPAAAGDLMVLF